MPKKQAALKLAILVIAPFSVIAGFGAYAGTFWYVFSQQKILSTSTSPSGRFRALAIEEFSSNGCGSTKSSFVVIERRVGFLKTGEFTAFCLADEASDFGFRWTAPNELTITCLACDPKTYEMYGARWGQATFRYELGPGNP